METIFSLVDARSRPSYVFLEAEIQGFKEVFEHFFYSSGDTSILVMESFYDHLLVKKFSEEAKSLILELFKKFPRNSGMEGRRFLLRQCYKLFEKGIIEPSFYTYVTQLFYELFLSKRSTLKKFFEIRSWGEYFAAHQDGAMTVREHVDLDTTKIVPKEDISFFEMFRTYQDYFLFRHAKLRTRSLALDKRLFYCWLGMDEHYRIEFQLQNAYDPRERLRIVEKTPC